MNRWVILGLLFVARFGLGFHFQSAGSVAPFLVTELDIEYSQIGTLIGLFMLPGLVLALPAGVISKRFGDRRVVSAGMVVMILGGIVSGSGQSYESLMVGRLMSGAGAAFLFVLMTKMLTDWFAEKELFFAMSIFIIGWPVGIASGQAIQGLIAAQFSQDFVFYLVSAGTAVGLVAIAGFYRSPASSRAMTDKPSLNLSGIEVWLVCIVGCMWMLITGAYLVMLGFGPVLLIEQGWSAAQAGLTVSTMSWVFLFALPVGGYLATRYSIPNVVMVVGLVVTIVVGALIPFVAAPLATFTVFGIAYALAVPVVGSLPVQVLRPENRGSGFGIYQIWYFAGSAFLPMVAGYLHHLTDGATSAILFSTAMMFGTLCLLGLLRIEQRRLGISR